MSAAASTLTSFEVSVGRAGTAFFWRKNVRVHSETHGTACFAPFEAGVEKDLVKALGFALRFDETRAGDNHRTFEVGGDFLSFDNTRCSSEVFDASISTGACSQSALQYIYGRFDIGNLTYKDFVKYNILHGCARLTQG